MKYPLAIFLMVALFSLSVRAQSDTRDWREFHSSLGFSVRYPNKWTKVSEEDKQLLISSSKKLVEAVIIPEGAQMISVTEQAPIANDDFLKAYKAERFEDQIIDYEHVERTEKDNRSYHDVFVIKSLNEVGPKTFYLQYNMYCKIANRLFVLELTQWKDDKFSKDSYDIAMKMLESLRIVG